MKPFLTTLYHWPKISVLFLTTEATELHGKISKNSVCIRVFRGFIKSKDFLILVLVCLTALCAFSEDTPTPTDLFIAFHNEAHAKLWEKPDAWKENSPGDEAEKAWFRTRTEQWGMHYLQRYTEFIDRYPDDTFVPWQAKQMAFMLWENINELEKPEYRKDLDAWKARWPSDNEIGRRFYTRRLEALAEQFPDIGSVEKIARALMAEYPMRREPYRALLSIARRQSADAYETTLQEILKSAGTPETIKTYLQGKASKAELDDEPDYRSPRERGDMEIDHYEIREIQLSVPLWESGTFGEEEERAIARTLIPEFPEQARPYRRLLPSASEPGGLSGARTWILAFVKGSAPDAVKDDVQECYWRINPRREYDKNFAQAMRKKNFPAVGKGKAWLDNYAPLWRTSLEAYADFVEGRLKCPKIDEVKQGAIRLLNELSRVTSEPEYRRHLDALNAKWLTLPIWNEDERLVLRSIQLYAQEADVSGHVVSESKFNHHAFDVYPPEVCEKVTRTLMKEFPKQGRPYSDILYLAKRKGPLERAMLQSILDSEAPDSVKKESKNTIAQMDRVGQPLELKGTVAGGQEIDVQQMKGKVILLNFWATSCGSCLDVVLPRIKSLYEKYHGHDFEVIGVNLDEEQETLKTFLKEKPTPWPHLWVKSWDTFGINAIPTLWLVDQQGILRDVKAREDLETKVEKLLAEP